MWNWARKYIIRAMRKDKEKWLDGMMKDMEW